MRSYLMALNLPSLHDLDFHTICVCQQCLSAKGRVIALRRSVTVCAFVRILDSIGTFCKAKNKIKKRSRAPFYNKIVTRNN